MKEIENPSWREFYKETVTFKKFLKRIMCNLELIFLIIKRMPRSVVEIGTGTGALSAFISWFLPTVVAIDNDKEVLKNAKNNCKIFGRKINFVAADAFALPFKDSVFSLCFSQGFFEHFQDNEIRNLMMEQLRVSKQIIIFNVPSDKYPVKPFGNERLLSPSNWHKIILSSLSIKSFRTQVRYCRVDIEAFKYFFTTKKWHGFFEIIGFLKIIGIEKNK